MRSGAGPAVEHRRGVPGASSFAADELLLVLVAVRVGGREKLECRELLRRHLSPSRTTSVHPPHRHRRATATGRRARLGAC